MANLSRRRFGINSPNRILTKVRSGWSDVMWETADGEDSSQMFRVISGVGGSC